MEWVREVWMGSGGQERQNTLLDLFGDGAAGGFIATPRRK